MSVARYDVLSDEETHRGGSWFRSRGIDASILDILPFPSCGIAEKSASRVNGARRRYLKRVDGDKDMAGPCGGGEWIDVRLLH